MAARKPRSAGADRATRKAGGSTSNPAGAGDLRVLARDAALAALRRLADLSRSEDERVALAATQELLNRAFGKASTGAADEASGSQPLVIRIVRFSDADVVEKGGQS
jgi:hypothetical protein